VVGDTATVRLSTVTRATAVPETYIKVDICNQSHKCLLDTGCDHSIIPRKLVPTATLESAQVEVTAANGSVIPILCHMTINFAIRGVALKADLLVTDEVDEFMLGFDWLTAQKANWDCQDNHHARDSHPTVHPPLEDGHTARLREGQRTNTREHGAKRPSQTHQTNMAITGIGRLGCTPQTDRGERIYG